MIHEENYFALTDLGNFLKVVWEHVALNWLTHHGKAQQLFSCGLLPFGSSTALGGRRALV